MIANPVQRVTLRGDMNQKRRMLVQLTALTGLMVSAGLLSPARAQEWNAAAFKATTLEDALKGLDAQQAPEESSMIKLSAPDVADNGALVPIGIETSLPATELAILVENNPSPLAALFMLPPGTEPYVMTRVKMNESSRVYAMAKVQDRWLVTTKEVMVTLGGCGA